jgi:cell division protein FtsW
MSVAREQLATDRNEPQETGRIDRVLLALTLVLVAIGLVMVFSASAITAGDNFGDPWHYFRRQAAFATVGLGLMAITAHIPYRAYRAIVYPLLGLTALMLLLVLIPGLGSHKGGATRWFQVGPFSFQPSELAKISLIVYLAYSLDKKQANIKSFSIGILPHLVISGVVLALILLEPDFGTTVTLGSILFLMMFLAGVNLTHLGYLLGSALPIFYFVMIGAEYRMRRLTTFLDPWEDPANAGFQIIQSWVALYNGGVLGQGLGAGKQKLFYLPEAHTDFVFSVLGEELGLVGVLAVIGLYVAFVLRGFKVARGAADLFGCLLGLGITSWLGLQTGINIAVVTGLLPTKGLVLPFLSYGGTSLMVAMMAVGILLNISSARSRVTRTEKGGWAELDGSRQALSPLPGLVSAPLATAGDLSRRRSDSTRFEPRLPEEDGRESRSAPARRSRDAAELYPEPRHEGVERRELRRQAVDPRRMAGVSRAGEGESRRPLPDMRRPGPISQRFARERDEEDEPEPPRPVIRRGGGA